MIKNGIIYETLGTIDNLSIVESSNKNEVRLSGVFGVCGVKNGNNRIYEKSNYGAMVKDIQERIALGEGVLGELEHPNTMNITLDNVSHMIEAIQMNDDGTVIGTIKLLNTPKGKIAQALVEGGCTLYISSRGAGSVDENGNVTLTTIKTYDLVGTPGFSQAKLHALNGNQKFENLNESLSDELTDFYMIVENDKKIDENLDIQYKKNKDESSSEDAKNTKDNKDITMEDIKKSIEALSQEISDLKAQLHIANESIKEQQEIIESIKSVNYDGIQEWVVNEFGSEFKDNLLESVQEELTASLTESISNNIKEWVTEEYSPIIEKWVTEEFGNVINDWITEEVLPSQMSEVQKILESEKENKFSNIDKMLDSLEKIAESKKVESVVDDISTTTESNKYDNCYAVKHIPNQYRPLWEALSDDRKDEIVTLSKAYNFSKDGVLESFWANQHLTDNILNESSSDVKETSPLSNIAIMMKRLR